MVKTIVLGVHRGKDMSRALIIDDDAHWCDALSAHLTSKGYDVICVGTCSEGEQAWRDTPPDCAVLDYELPDGNGLGLLSRLRAIDFATPIVVLTAYGTIDLAVEAIKKGASQFLVKPVELAAVSAVISQELGIQRPRRRQVVKRESDDSQELNPFLGSSAAIQRLADLAHKVAAADRPLLIQGETGSGKGVLAHWIHRHSGRSSERFVDLNCGGLSHDLLETELFGHEKGAFTGAVQAKSGLLEIAHKGTVFLDEIGDVDLRVQPKLLKVLEEKRFRRLGDTKDRQVDLRLIAATHRDLREMVRKKTFRSDLYFRISTIPLTIPALRERTEDIPLLAQTLLSDVCADLALNRIELSKRAIRELQMYPWPGNVRELRNVLERAAILCGGNMLEEKDLHFDLEVCASQSPLGALRTLQQMERDYIEEVLKVERRVSSAAVRLGIPRSSLYQKIKNFGIARVH